MILVYVRIFRIPHVPTAKRINFIDQCKNNECTFSSKIIKVINTLSKTDSLEIQ